MNLVQTYLDSNGYDYYGNAAEDTLVFFVQDAEAPSAEPGGTGNESITNLSDDTVNGISGGLSSEAAAVPDTNEDADDFSDSVPKMAEMDTKQTDTEHSTDGKVKV